MEVGFCVTTAEGNTTFHIFGPPGTDSLLVTTAKSAEHLIVLMGKLYHTDDILGRLTHSLSKDALARCKENDAHLALAAYAQLGTEGLESIEGDFSIAVWDSLRARLVGVRDPMGGYPLFWTQQGQTFALSTGLQPLIDIVGRRSLNRDYLAEFLMIPGPVNERAGRHCVYEGVQRILPGEILNIDLCQGRVTCYTYWNWLDKIVYPKSEHFDETAEDYRKLLDSAVLTRLSGPAAAHLSGGMDSTTVALIARNMVGSGRAPSPLHTISLTYEALPGLARERPFLESVLDDNDERGFVAHRVVADSLLDFDSFRDPPLHDEPYVGLWRMGLDRATVKAAADVGATVVLTGIGADEMLDVQPFYITDLLRRGQLWKAWTEATRWALQDNCNAWGILYPFGIANLLATSSWGGVINSILRRHQSTLRRHDDWSISPWIVPSFTKQQALRGRARHNALRTYTSSDQTALSFALDSIASRTGDVTRWAVAAPRGLLIAHPFLDLRVLRFSLGVMATLNPEPKKMKPLLAAATRGLLPERIRTRRRKGQFNEVYFLGLARNRGYLEEMVRQAPIDDLKLIDKNILVHYLREAALGGAHVRQLHRLNLTLCLIRWLTLQDKWQNKRQTASATIPHSWSS